MSLDRLSSPLLVSLLILLLAILELLVLRLAAKRVLRALRATKELDEERRQRLFTLVQILQWVSNILIIVIAMLMLLSTWGVDITPLLAGAGVAGLAVSLGAQTLIQDSISGLLILLENQYAVGDVIEVGSVSGVVERLTLRATYVRDTHGRLHIIPNGEARIVSNLTKNWSRALVDVGVAYEEDLDRVLHVLEGAAETFAQDSAWGPHLLETPQVVGPISLGDWAITVRVMVKTQPGEQWKIAYELRKRILAACEREGITLPYPRQEVLLQRDAKSL